MFLYWVGVYGCLLGLVFCFVFFVCFSYDIIELIAHIYVGKGLVLLSIVSP